MFSEICKNCGGELKLESQKDLLGHNITKNVTFSFWMGPTRYTETWKCNSCEHQEINKYWSWF